MMAQKILILTALIQFSRKGFDHGVSHRQFDKQSLHPAFFYMSAISLASRSVLLVR
ncbi:hypothetical protein K8352_18005 [Flavobacteriaceae bacterium F89]|uniref:Uncharacterized protein n=1 Tax=Cerina litoralis TaxID=2874477 RepID=A0AAE3JQZ0_9FLAO|nr:hypothetical protein [Cerina litoralis]MCG2462661.1 hypothetical protein [Cerina litoralis]